MIFLLSWYQEYTQTQTQTLPVYYTLDGVNGVSFTLMTFMTLIIYSWLCSTVNIVFVVALVLNTESGMWRRIYGALVHADRQQLQRHLSDSGR